MGVGPFVGPDALPGDGAGGVTELGRDHPGAGDEDKGDAVNFAVTKRECEWAVWGAGRAIPVSGQNSRR